MLSVNINVRFVPQADMMLSEATVRFMPTAQGPRTRLFRYDRGTL
jgi:hypothetical protein